MAALRGKPLSKDASAAEVAKSLRDQVAATKALDKQYPIPKADFDTYMTHVMHALDLVGPDHVGIGADWDGGGGVTGMEDITALPKITERLVKAGYTEAQLANFWGGNALRVLGKARDARKPV